MQLKQKKQCPQCGNYRLTVVHTVKDGGRYEAEQQCRCGWHSVIRVKRRVA